MSCLETWQVGSLRKSHTFTILCRPLSDAQFVPPRPSSSSPHQDNTISRARIILSSIMVHVKYPSMERQDLTQAQLGSFKFTPVDEVRPDAAMFPPHPRLAKQYVTSLKTAELIDQHFRRPDTASSSAPSFYDYDSKSSLDNSSSRLRPIAVRQALASDNISAHACAPDISLASYVSTMQQR